jgi:hypothetical protein
MQILQNLLQQQVLSRLTSWRPLLWAQIGCCSYPRISTAYFCVPCECNAVVGSVATGIVERSAARTHLWLVFLFVMLLRDSVRLFAAVESSKKPNELLTCLRQLQKLEAAFTFAGVSVSPDGEL